VGAWQTGDGTNQLFIKPAGDREYRLTYQSYRAVNVEMRGSAQIREDPRLHIYGFKEN
jgi:hypothetical protein